MSSELPPSRIRPHLMLTPCPSREPADASKRGIEGDRHPALAIVGVRALVAW